MMNVITDFDVNLFLRGVPPHLLGMDQDSKETNRDKPVYRNKSIRRDSLHLDIWICLLFSRRRRF